MTFNDSVEIRLLEGKLKAEGCKVARLNWKSNVGKGLDDFVKRNSEIKITINQSQERDSIPKPGIVFYSNDLAVLRNLKEKVQSLK